MLNNDTFLPNLMLKNLLKEGQKNFQDGFFSRSIKYYTKVDLFLFFYIFKLIYQNFILLFKILNLSPGHKIALVERAICFFKLGEYDLALTDVDEALRNNNEYLKVINELFELLLFYFKIIIIRHYTSKLRFYLVKMNLTWR